MLGFVGVIMYEGVSWVCGFVLLEQNVLDSLVWGHASCCGDVEYLLRCDENKWRSEFIGEEIKIFLDSLMTAAVDSLAIYMDARL